MMILLYNGNSYCPLITPIDKFHTEGQALPHLEGLVNDAEPALHCTVVIACVVIACVVITCVVLVENFFDLHVL